MDKMTLVITLRRDVPDKSTAKNIVQLVKGWMESHPEVTITSHTTDHFDLPEPPL